MPYADDFSTYTNLRQVLSPDLAVAPSSAIRTCVDAEFGEGAADAMDDQMESLFGDIGHGLASAAHDVGHFAVQAAPVVAQVGGGALQGAMAGSALGPIGMIAGAAAGGTGVALSKYGGGTAHDIGGALTGITGLAGQFSPMGRVGSALGPAISGLAGGGKVGALGAASGLLNGVLGAVGGGAVPGGAGQALSALFGGGSGGAGGGVGQLLSGLLGSAGGGGIGQAAGALSQAPAAAQALAGLFGGGSAMGQLASFMQRPETQQAFAALQLRGLGRPTVPVGAQRTPVPTAAFPGVLSHLADQAVNEAAGWAGEGEAPLAYMRDSEGEYVGDPAFDRDRASRVWDLLNEAQAERALEEMASVARPPPRPAAYARRAAEAFDADAEWYDAMDQIELAALESGAEWSSEDDYAAA